jgi:hypothetical protein
MTTIAGVGVGVIVGSSVGVDVAGGSVSVGSSVGAVVGGSVVGVVPHPTRKPNTSKVSSNRDCMGMILRL